MRGASWEEGKGCPLGGGEWVGGYGILPKPRADRGTGQLWPGRPTPCILATGSWTSCFPPVNKQELPLWPCTDKTQPGQGLHFLKAANSPSLLEASLQCFEDLLHLLRLRVWADGPLPQRAIHLGGFCRHSRPHRVPLDGFSARRDGAGGGGGGMVRVWV